MKSYSSLDDLNISSLFVNSHATVDALNKITTDLEGYLKSATVADLISDLTNGDYSLDDLMSMQVQRDDTSAKLTNNNTPYIGLRFSINGISSWSSSINLPKMLLPMLINYVVDLEQVTMVGDVMRLELPFNVIQYLKRHYPDDNISSTEQCLDLVYQDIENQFSDICSLIK